MIIVRHCSHSVTAYVFSSIYFIGARGARQSQPTPEPNRNQIYCIERELPTLDYNEVMSQSKESNKCCYFLSKFKIIENKKIVITISVELPTYDEAIKQYQKHPQQIITA